jgi:hypothetical protein
MLSAAKHLAHPKTSTPKRFFAALRMTLPAISDYFLSCRHKKPILPKKPQP